MLLRMRLATAGLFEACIVGLSLPRQPSILDGQIQETTGVDVAHWCRPIHLYRVVRSYWLFAAVRSSRLLGYPYRDRRSRQLPRCWATYRFASSWRSIGWSRYLESLLCSTRACTSPDHRHPDAKPLPVYSKAGDFRADVGRSPTAPS